MSNNGHIFKVYLKTFEQNLCRLSQEIVLKKLGYVWIMNMFELWISSDNFFRLKYPKLTKYICRFLASSKALCASNKQYCSVLFIIALFKIVLIPQSLLRGSLSNPHGFIQKWSTFVIGIIFADFCKHENDSKIT